MPAADLGAVEIEGRGRPGRGEQFQNRRTECGSAGVAGFEGVEAALQLLLQTRGVDFESVENFRGVAGGVIQQLQEDVLDLDVVMSSSEAQAGGGFEGSA